MRSRLILVLTLSLVALLGFTASAGATPSAQPESTAGTGHDLLRGNGLISPWCLSGVAGPGGLIAQQNCHTSGLQSISGSGDEIGFDVHVDSGGFLGTPDPAGTVDATILKLVSVVWALMVLVTKVVFLGVELALSFNPLDSSHAGSWAAQLNATVQTVTHPLALVFAPVGGIWLLWTAAARRRHGEALKHLALGVLLVIGASVVLANPVGTVGAAITLSQKVGLAIIGATSSARSSSGRATAQSGLRAMGDAVIEQPLALLEFGDTDWGTNPSRLDPKLRAAALALAADDTGKLARVRAARTNLKLFEVWPAGSQQRNSINDEKSLLRTLCASDDDTDCKGPNADRAEFRTGKGMWQRIVAITVIGLGVIPFWLCMGYVAFKLIGAGLMCVIRLFQLAFMAPLVLIGQAGTERMVSWAGDFFGSIIASAVYSAYLSLVMLIWRAVSAWGGYGFVLQWLLLALALVLLIVHRRRLWGVVGQSNSAMHSAGVRTAGWVAYAAGRSALSGRGGTRAGGSRVVGTRPTRSVTPAALPARRAAAGGGQAAPVLGAARTVGRAGPGPSAGSGNGSTPPTDRQLGQARRQRAAQVSAVRDAHLTDLRSRNVTDAEALRTRRARIDGARTRREDAPPAATRGARQRNRRREQSLRRRAQEVRTTLERRANEERRLRSADADPQKIRRATASFLDAQAGLPRGQHVNSGYRGPEAPRRRSRDYPALAGLAGSTPASYRAAPAAQQVRMRARIDRELRQRVVDRDVVRAAGQQSAPRPTPTSVRAETAVPRVAPPPVASRASASEGG